MIQSANAVKARNPQSAEQERREDKERGSARGRTLRRGENERPQGAIFPLLVVLPLAFAPRGAPAGILLKARSGSFSQVSQYTLLIAASQSFAVSHILSQMTKATVKTSIHSTAKTHRHCAKQRNQFDKTNTLHANMQNLPEMYRMDKRML